MDGPPTTLAHQLPRVASSIPCPGPPEGAVTRQACAGPYEQYCDRCVHQQSRRSALPSHVATRPPSPPLESEASEVTSRHSYPWCAQPCVRDQVVSLQALPLEEADPALALLCPVRALRLYTNRTQSLRTSDQLFVCYGGQQKGKAVSKQRMAHWIVDAIALAYQAQGVPCPLRLRAHSTRGVASSWALARGASLTDICRAAGWATPNMFARFYSLHVEPVSSCVLTSGQGHREVPA